MMEIQANLESGHFNILTNMFTTILFFLLSQKKVSTENFKKSSKTHYLGILNTSLILPLPNIPSTHSELASKEYPYQDS